MDEEGSRKMAYAVHSMEKGANLNVGLPDYWHIGQRDPSAVVRHWDLHELDTPDLPGGALPNDAPLILLR
jgi:hypothetical protein